MVDGRATVPALLADVRTALREAADPDRARVMQAVARGWAPRGAVRRHRADRSPGHGELLLLPLIEEMITTGAWRDMVDGLAERSATCCWSTPPTRSSPCAKAIGWALRDLATTDLDRVRQSLASHGLSPPSR